MSLLPLPPIRRIFATIPALWLAVGMLAAGTAAADEPPVTADAPAVSADALKTRIESTDALTAAGMTLDRAALQAGYQPRGYEPVWAEHPDLVPGFLTALAAADREGLDPESFRLGALKSALDDASLSPLDREMLLSDRFLAYAAALAHGRVAPASVYDDWFLPQPDFDSSLALQRLGGGEAVDAVLQSLLPKDAQYDRLREALQHYQALAQAGGWQQMPPLGKTEKI